MVTGVKDYLESLPEAVLTRLYRSPATCLSVLRLLPPLGKVLVLSFIYLEGPIPLDAIDSMVKKDSRRLQMDTMQTLSKMSIVKEKYASRTLVVNSTFIKSLRCALTQGEANNLFGVPLNSQKVSKEFLRQVAKDKWESLLHFIVGSTLELSNTKRPSAVVLDILVKSGFLARKGPILSITREGFQFLLKDLNSQLWALLLHYLNQAVDLQMDPVEILNFIFMLGSLEFGSPYDLRQLTGTQVGMLEALCDIGMIYRDPNSTLFYPTQLATTLTSDREGGRLSEESRGFVILETNYRLYAYTDSPLQISILSLFCQMRARYTNLVVGRITRDSIRVALGNGITGDQIIEYLSVNAHERMRETAKSAVTVLPPTVVDQIKLWQLELDRFSARPGFLYKDFPSINEYNLIVSYVQDLGALIWKNDGKRMFFVDKESNPQVVEYINRKMH